MGFWDIFKTKQFKEDIQKKDEKIAEYEKLYANIGASRFEDVTKKVEEVEKIRSEKSGYVQNLQNALDELTNEINLKKIDIEAENANLETLKKKSLTKERRIRRSDELFRSMNSAFERFVSTDEPLSYQTKKDINELDELYPSVILKLHNMDVKSLRKVFKENDKQIDKVLAAYEVRYTTKANKSIYNLMVIALRAELQNILYNLKYSKLDDAITQVQTVTRRYLQVAEDGNQNIAPTLRKFIGEIEYLFINSVKIEYNYFVKKEQEKRERLEIQQQMRQEAAERKALEQEKKRVQAEEEKFQQELARNEGLLLEATSQEEIENLNKRILELQGLLTEVVIKKDEIASLQHGKAGTVYIISNKGSFGENVFKIGMTRRLDPMDRVNELGSASVPFRFDVHSLIFSHDAVGLESELHKRLSNNRVNRVNMRKEFFASSIEELESIVNEIDPTAEFVTNMEAEEFNQSLSTTENYVLDEIQEDDEDLEFFEKEK